MQTGAALTRGHDFRVPLWCMWLLASVVCVGAQAGWAQAVGSVAQLEGGAELGRGGRWTAVAVGTAVDVGDVLRTARHGRLRVVFHDASVLVVTDDSRVVIDAQTLDEPRGAAQTLLRLVAGKVRALVGRYYTRPGSRFALRSADAVAGVRGTEFAMAYDAATGTTEVVGIHGRVEVHSVLDLAGHAVFVTARNITTVRPGRYPTWPEQLRDQLFRQYLEDLQFIGAGQPESFVAALPLLNGTNVPEPDRPATAGSLPPQASVPANAPGESPYDARTVGDLLQQPPAAVTKGGISVQF
jgi:FecR protein